MGIFKRDSDGRPGRGRMGLGLADRRAAPLSADEQDTPEPERPTRLDEESGTAVHEVEEPPQAEG